MTLQEFFQKHPRIAIAFSGGTDSAYLLYMAKQYAKEIMAFYVSSAFQPAFELADARRFCEEYDIPMTVLKLDILKDETVKSNPANRCYYCKSNILTTILDAAEEAGFRILADGTNASDDATERAGTKALRELNVLSPLRICGITKDQLRTESAKLGLFTAKKPAYACLATRIPAGTPLTVDILHKIEKAETVLAEMGFSDFRIRYLDGAAKIQVTKTQFSLVMEKRAVILDYLKPLFTDIYLDLKAR